MDCRNDSYGTASVACYCCRAASSVTWTLCLHLLTAAVLGLLKMLLAAEEVVFARDVWVEGACSGTADMR